MRNVVGIGGSGHDFATCLITEDGRFMAIEDERITRVRYALHSPEPCLPSLHYCLDWAGLSIDEIDMLVGNDVLAPVIREHDFPKLQLINHHLTHAYSTFFTSAFEEAAILIVDGSGSLVPSETIVRARETTTYYRGAGNSVALLGQVSGGNGGTSYDPKAPRLKTNSLGDYYRVITEAIGFEYLQAGKTMGLASYGAVKDDQRFVPEIMRCVKLLPQGQFEIVIGGEQGLVAVLRRAREEALRTEPAFDVDAGIAYSGQIVLETLLLHCLEFLWERTRTPNLCLAGGVALNSLANGKLIGATPFEQVHVFFAPGDGGTAIGAAIWGLLQHGGAATGQTIRFPLEPYLGRTYSAERVEAALRGAGVRYERSPNIYRQTAELLNAGLVVAWYQGGSEFGPRALGNRSILADPRSESLRQHINQHVKQREWFRPFAPAVIERAAATYFEPRGMSAWMQFVWPVYAEYQALLAGITHVDGTARVQILKKESNAAFYSLLEAFERVSGVPIVLNTSFNTEGGPIVETPEEAVATFVNSQLDALAIDEFVAIKSR